MVEKIIQIDSGKAQSMAGVMQEISSAQVEQNPYQYAKEALVEPVMTALSLANTKSLDQTKHGVSKEKVLQHTIQAWQKEDANKSMSPRLAWVSFNNKWVLSSIFPIDLQLGQSNGQFPAIVITPSAVTKDWWEVIQTHPNAEKKEGPEAISRIITLYSGFMQSELVDQYQSSCGNPKAPAREAIQAFSHQDGPISVMLAIAANANRNLVDTLLLNNKDASLHGISHLHGDHGLTKPKSQHVAKAQVATGLLGGMPLTSYIFAPGVSNSQLINITTGFPALDPKTDIELLMFENSTRRSSAQLPLNPDMLLPLQTVLRSFGMAVNLEENDMKQFQDRVENEGDETSMVAIASLSLGKM